MLLAKNAVLVLALWLVVPMQQPDRALPPGYRIPGPTDYVGQWQENRATFPIPFHVRADFNGDSVIDDAWILLTGREHDFGFFVFLVSRGGASEWIKLESGAYAQAVGLRVVRPGRYATACDKGFGSECSPSERKSLRLVRPAIEFFEFESSSSYFWWDANTKTFKQTWVSD